MKKLSSITMAIMLLLCVTPGQSKAMSFMDSTIVAPAVIKDKEAARAAELLARLNQINAMNKSALGSSDKKELRREVLGINKALKSTSRGVYLSVGAIIIIVLLLILLK